MTIPDSKKGLAVKEDGQENGGEKQKPGFNERRFKPQKHSKFPLWATVLLGGIMIVFCWNKISIRSDMDQFLGTLGDAEMIRLSRQLANSELSRTIILTIAAENADGSANLDAAVQVAQDMASQLRKDSDIEWVRTGIPSEDQRSIYELYFPRRFALMSDNPNEELPLRWTKENLHRSAESLKQQLATVSGDIVKRLAPADPWRNYLEFLQRLEQMREGGLALHQGQLVSEDQQAIIFMATGSSAFDGSKQLVIQNRLVQELESAKQRYLDGVSKSDQTLARCDFWMEQSSVARFAVAAETSIRSDISRISSISTMMVLTFFGVVFRSLRVIILAFLPMIFGLLSATTVTLFVFGEMHGLTLAFGATLIGICIDYPIHLLSHYFFGHRLEGMDARETLAKIRSAIILGAVTTLVGFCGLGWTSFPGVREIAFFTGIGIASALLVTIFVLPAGLQEASVGQGQKIAAISSFLLLALRSISRFRKSLAVIALLGLTVLIVGVFSIAFDDDVATWTYRDPDLVAEDNRVRHRVARMEGGQVVVAMAEDEESALQANDEVFLRLQQVQEQGGLQGFRSLHSLLWSQSLQEKNLQQITSHLDLAKDTLDGLEQYGFVRDAFSPFVEDLKQLQTDPKCSEQRCLDWSQLKSSPLGRWAQPFWIGFGDDIGVLTMLRGVSNPELIARTVEQVPGVKYFDQAILLRSIYGDHRKQILQLVALGLLGVFLLVWFRYRKIHSAMLVCVPAIFAAPMALVILTYCGFELHLLHAVCLLLILSMGVDYGVFLLESRSDLRAFKASLMSACMACTSTLLAFGLLGLSEHPALASIGLTVSIGVSLSLLFSILGFAWAMPAFSKEVE